MNTMYNRQTIWVLVMIIVMVAGCRMSDTENPVFRTISNPLNLNYRFCLNDVSAEMLQIPVLFSLRAVTIFCVWFGRILLFF